MAVDFSEVEVGDKVRLTAENGDTSSFTVMAVTQNASYIESATNLYYYGEWDHLETMEKVFKLLPGLYTQRNEHGVVMAKLAVTSSGETYYTSATGAWREGIKPENGWTREITFS